MTSLFQIGSATRTLTSSSRRGGTRKEARLQLALGLNLVAAAVGLPFAWSTVVSAKLDAQKARRAARLASEVDDYGLSPAEQHAMQTVVNDRRRKRGQELIKYDDRSAAAAAGKALAASAVVRRQMALTNDITQ